MSKSPALSAEAIEVDMLSIHSSNVEVNSSKTPLILVTSRVDPKTNEVHFFVNSKQRAQTALGGDSQGDHVTAYIAIIESLLAKADAEGIRNALNKVEKFGLQILKGPSLAAFQEKALSKPDVHKHEDRKELGRVNQAFVGMAQEINGNPDLERELAALFSKFNVSDKFHALKTDPKELENLKKIIKENDQESQHAKVSKMATQLCDLANSFLTEIQNDPNSTTYSTGRIRGPNEKAAGDQEKGAARALTALDMVCELNDLAERGVKEKFAAKLASFSKSLEPLTNGSSETQEDHLAYYGMRRWMNRETNENSHPRKKANLGTNFCDPGILRSTLMMHQNDPEKIRETLATLKEEMLNPNRNKATVSGFMGDLFDYKKQVNFDLNKAFIPNKTERFEGLTRIEIAERKFDPNLHSISQRNNVISITRTNVDNLAGRVAKHLNIIDAAYPNLQKAREQNVQQGLEDKITENFLAKEVLQKDGWDQHVTEARTWFFGSNKMLNLADLLDKVTPLILESKVEAEAAVETASPLENAMSEIDAQTSEAFANFDSDTKTTVEVNEATTFVRQINERRASNKIPTYRSGNSA